MTKTPTPPLPPPTSPPYLPRESAQGPPLPPPEGTPPGRTVLCCEGQALSPVGPPSRPGSPTLSLHAPTHWQGTTVVPPTNTCAAVARSPGQSAIVALPRQPYAAVAPVKWRSAIVVPPAYTCAIVVQPTYRYAIAAPPLGPCDTTQTWPSAFATGHIVN